MDALSLCTSEYADREEITLYRSARFSYYGVEPDSASPKSADAQANASDSVWQALRDGFKLPALNPTAVHQQAQRYASGRYHLQPTFERASLYLFYIVQELRTKGMPTEIALIPLIESSYSPIQKGSMHHAGIWGSCR